MTSPILVAELGSGGMADVYLAMRRGMGGFIKLVVVKQLRTSAIEGDAIAAFHDEARISARLNHPNVVQTHEVGFDGEHYRLEMEYLDGQPLHRIVHRAKKAGRAISHGVTVALVRDVLAGLRYAHELRDYDGSTLGIVHRDVSPQNIFVTYDGRVKLVDFGIAKVAGQMAVTQLGMVKGKIRYMAPEQATGRPVDARADVFATGIVLWQLLVGHGYWADAVDDISIFHRMQVGRMPPSPRTLNPEVSEALDRVCARALAYDPDDRYATADEFDRALEACGVAATRPERSLASLAAELFADAREAIRTEIEKAAARPAGETDNRLTKLALSSESSVSEPDPPHPSDRPVSRAVRTPERPRSRWAFGGLVLAAAGAAWLGAMAIAPRSTPQVGPTTTREPPGPLLLLNVRPAVANADTSADTSAQPSATPDARRDVAALPFPSAAGRSAPGARAGGASGPIASLGAKAGASSNPTEVLAPPVVDAGAPVVPRQSRLPPVLDLATDPWDGGPGH